MNSLTILDNIQIASPCDVEWDQMTGDDRTRFCSSCSKHVYNIMAMTAEEATRLILEREGRLCVRIYKRDDGTVLTADCPVGFEKIATRRRLRQALAVVCLVPALAVAGTSALGISIGNRQFEPFPTGPTVTWNDRLNWALLTLGLRSPTPPPPPGGRIIAGDVMM